MVEIPTPEALAMCVDETTQAMYGVPMAYAGECPNELPTATDKAPTVIVPLIGAPLYIITAHAKHDGGKALASAMFSCPEQETDADMVEDSLRELCNIIAGQVKSLVAPEHEIGLPSRFTDASTMKDIQHWSGARIKVGQHQAEVDIAVAEFPGFG